MMTQKMILQNQDYWMCITRLLNKRRLLKYLLLSLSISKSKNRNWLRTKKLAWTVLHIKILKNWISWLLNPYMYTKKNTLLITESRHVHKRKKILNLPNYWIQTCTQKREYWITGSPYYWIQAYTWRTHISPRNCWKKSR